MIIVLKKVSSRWHPGADLIILAKPGYSSIKYANFIENQNQSYDQGSREKQGHSVIMSEQRHEQCPSYKIPSMFLF